MQAGDNTAATAWPPITVQSRPWTRWWWMGDAVTGDGLQKELARYHAAGIGGVEVTPIYGVQGNGANEIPYLSGKWMGLLNSAIASATQLGMQVDMTTGTGWCFGGPTVLPGDGCAKLVSSVQMVSAGSAPTGSFDPATTQALVAVSFDGKIQDLTSSLQSGHLNWTAPGGEWRVYAISQKSTKLMVKRAAPGGEGLMANPLYSDGIARYMSWFDGSFGQGKPHLNALFQDSYEYNSEWTPDFFSWFQKLRGYPLQEHLPEFLDGKEDDASARVKSDYRETVSDLMIGHSMPVWVKWAHDHGYLARYQAHGAPANLLDLYAIADVPETEFDWKNRDILLSKFASSAAHVTGKNIASSETATWLTEHFNETLAALKVDIDEFFLAGINHVVFQGTAYTPGDAAWPGWCFYASVELKPMNTIWHDLPALNTYIARCQSVLQSGQSDNDVLVYWPIYDTWNDAHGMAQGYAIDGKGWFHGQPIDDCAKRLWDAGYAFDYISDRQIAALKAGTPYRAIVVPACRLMPVETLRKLTELAAAGMTVIFDGKVPEDVPGLNNLDARRKAFHDLLAKAPPHAGEAVAALQASGINGEEITARFPGLRFVRRRTSDGITYFIVNRGGSPVADSIKLNAPAGAVEFMDPMTGRTGLAASSVADGHPNVRFALDPGQSIIVRVFNGPGIDLAAWSYPPATGTPAPLTGTWNITFTAGGPTLPAPVQTQNLGSWTQLSDPALQAFAGTAVYALSFDAPSQAKTWTLDLGKVCESARVRLNGHDLGTLITAPYVIHGVTLQPRGNVLEVKVTSTAANRIRDMDIRQVKWKIFDKPNLLSVNYKPLDASKWPVRDCGLLGPVTLAPEP